MFNFKFLMINDSSEERLEKLNKIDTKVANHEDAFGKVIQAIMELVGDTETEKTKKVEFIKVENNNQ